VVEDIVPEGRAQVMVRLKMNGVVLLACLTNKSASTLQLENGLSVFVQVKSVAILS
jgi:molybdopterin-binding protein